MDQISDGNVKTQGGLDDMERKKREARGIEGSPCEFGKLL